MPRSRFMESPDAIFSAHWDHEPVGTDSTPSLIFSAQGGTSQIRDGVESVPTRFMGRGRSCEANGDSAGLIGWLPRIGIERGKGELIGHLVVHRDEYLSGLDRRRDKST